MFGKLASTSFGTHFKDSMHKILDIEPLQTINEETTTPIVKTVSQSDKAATQASGGGGEDVKSMQTPMQTGRERRSRKHIIVERDDEDDAFR